MVKTIKGYWIAPLASLRLTVCVLVLSMLLIFFGTLAQTTRGIWWVMDAYFTSWFVWVPLSVFSAPTQPLRGAFPFPGGSVSGSGSITQPSGGPLGPLQGDRQRRPAHGGPAVLLLVGAGLIVAFHNLPLAGRVNAGYGLAAMLGVGALMYVPALLVRLRSFWSPRRNRVDSRFVDPADRGRGSHPRDGG